MWGYNDRTVSTLKALIFGGHSTSKNIFTPARKKDNRGLFEFGPELLMG